MIIKSYLSSEPAQYLHRWSREVFVSQSYSAKDFLILEPRFRAASLYLQKKDYLEGQNSFPIDWGHLYHFHL